MGSEENQPKLKFTVAPEISNWINENFPLLETAESVDEWDKLDKEFQKRSEESEEFRLDYLRHQNPQGSEEIDILEEKLIQNRRLKEREELHRNQEEFESKILKNLLTNYSDVIRAMSLIDGEGETEQQEKEGMTSRSALIKLESYRQTHSEEDEQKKTYSSPITTIYGPGGLHRYFVYYDGKVKYSGGHSEYIATERARRLGFEIVP